MPISDLTGTTWKLNSSLTSYAGGSYSKKRYSVNITTSKPIVDEESFNYYDTFTEIVIGYNSGAECNEVFLAFSLYSKAVLAYGNDTKSLPDSWTYIADVRFTITGGSDVTNSALITWLEANATIPVDDVVISYNDAEIASMSDSGTKTLETEGKYCADDITISYTKPLPLLQTKTISPYTLQRTVEPDTGYDGLSSVTVNAISPTKSAQTYYPSSSDQTVSSGRWLTGNQTFKGVQIANLTAGNIKDGVTVTVGDSSNPSRVASVTGTYSGGGGGGLQVYTSTSGYGENETFYFDYPNGIDDSDFDNLKAGVLKNVYATVDSDTYICSKLTFCTTSISDPSYIGYINGGGYTDGFEIFFQIEGYAFNNVLAISFMDAHFQGTVYSVTIDELDLII